MSLNENFKINTAKEITELAIQHGLIFKYDSEEETADSICKFFKTIVKKLDSEE